MTGYLRIFVTEANGTIPVPGARVVITEYAEDGSGGAVYSLRTNDDGLTETASLPTPDVRESQSPGALRPYGLYGINVDAAGFYPVEHAAVPVFPGITSDQQVNLLPLSEEDAMPGAFGQVMIYETPDMESLQPGGLQREDVDDDNGEISGNLRG